MKYLAAVVILLVFLAGHTARQERPSAAGLHAPDTPASESGDLVASGVTTVIPGAQYEAGTVKRWLLGRYYRDVWTTPLQVPIIDLERSAGGLTPIERGGGAQTATLHLRGGDGHMYHLRSVDKTVTNWLPEKYHGTFVERLAQDQISSLNPLAPLILPELALAAGLLYTVPSLVVIPNSPRLGAFRDEFSGMLALFEREADENQSDAAHFGFSKNIVGTKKLFEKMHEDSSVHVDERAYARARLFDMLIGDWDRHENQWRWAEFDVETGTRYVPVPEDRDFAFVKFDGLLNRITRWSGKMVLRRLVDFGDDIRDVRALNWQALGLDRRLTGSLKRDDWTSIADSLKRALPDPVIHRAVQRWPKPVFDLVGPMTARNLKSRRDVLPDVAGRYYDLLADTTLAPEPREHSRPTAAGQ